MRTEGKEVNISMIAGIFSVIFLVIEITGLLMIISKGSSIGALDFFILLGFSYVAYRTLIKRTKLRLFEWVAFIVLSIVFIALIIIGLIVGVVEAYEEEVTIVEYVNLSLWYKLFK